MNTTKKNTALKAGIWYTISAIAVKAINIITTPIFTRMMNTADYGLAQTFNSWSSLLMIFCSLNLVYSIGRAKLDFPGQLDKYVGAMQMLALSASSVIGILMLIFIKPVAVFMEMNTNLIIILVVYILAYPVIPLWSSKFKYQYRYKGNIAITAYITIVSVFITLVLMFQFETDRYYAKVLGTVITGGLLALAFWIHSIKRKTISINKTYWRYGLKISLPLILHSLSLNVLSQSDRIMITKFVGTDETGIYSLAYNYAILVNIVLGAVNDAWLPWFHDNLFAGNKNDIRTKVKPLVVLGCMMGLGCIAIAPEAIYILGPVEYQSGRWVVGPVVLGLICQFIYQQYVHIELHEKQTQYISMGTILAAIMNIFLNFIFIPVYGFVAAAYTTMFCYFVLMFVHLFITKRFLNVKLYDDPFMFIALIVSAVLTILFMITYSTILIRYTVLIILCIIYFISNKKYLMAYINGKKKKS